MQKLNRAERKAPSVTQFESDLQAAILATIKRERSVGTTRMGLACLLQCVRPPQGGPSGTNAGYYYAEIFEKVCQETPAIRRFIIGA